MTGGEPTKQREQKYPWQLAVAVVAWIVLGAVLVVGALSSNKSKSEADQGSVEAIQSSLGSSYASAGQSGVNAPVWLVLGGVILLLALLLLVGQGWARHALAALGLVAVVVLALAGRWETVVAFVVLILGTVPLLAPSAHRYLSGR